MTHALDSLAREAASLQRLGRRREAIDAYERLLRLRPTDSEAWYNLGWLLRHEARFDAALAAYGEALAHRVRDPHEVHLNRAAILSDHLQRDFDAERELETALALAPGYAQAHLNLGNLFEERGDRGAAIARYEALLALPASADAATASCRADALARLAQLRPPRDADDPLLAQLAQAGAGAGVDVASRANAWFALGRSLDRLDLPARAFEAFESGNRLARSRGRAYQPERMRQLVDAIIAGDAARAGDASDVEASSSSEPLFVCGMFRSGSTLLERVLAAHPQVAAGGEVDWFPRLAAGPLAPFPTAPARLDANAAARLAHEYRSHVHALFPLARERRYLTDKRPDNFLLLGLIRRVFPRARIIDTVRDPLDTGWSIYTHHLDAGGLPYASDLADIGHYYGQYRRLMAHWRSRFADDLVAFDYDAFVRAPRATLEPLLHWLGLEWDERCLEFHRQPATVKTASYWQVREPLHASASGRSRRYAPWLVPLRDALRRGGIPCPD